MNRSLKLSMMLALALGSSQAAALELGQIQVKSALGQPLLAEIPLTPENPAELQNLSARLASPDDFVRAGISTGRPEMPLQFSVASVDGHKVIRITSAVAINDPYLDLLVEVSSGAGKSVREYTILLDPPSSMIAAPAVSSAPARASRPASAAASSAAAAAPAAHHAAASQPAAASHARSGDNGTYGPVERGQTLSGIALKTMPAGVDVNQMLLALKQANPDAFYRDNINALKSGTVLRVPTSQEAQAMSVAAALSEVRRQNGEWRSPGTAMPTTVADAATRADTSSAPSSAVSDADRLSLVPAKQGSKNAGAAGGKDGKSASALRQDLLRSQETLTTLQQQSGELKSRLKDLEDINHKNERLLSMKDNEIAELQQKLAEARKAANLPAEPAAKAGAVAAPKPAGPTGLASAKPGATTPASAGSSAAMTPPASAATVASAVVSATPIKPVAEKPVAAKAKPAPAKPTTRPAPAPAGEAPWYMQPWAWGGGVVALLLLVLLGRRRKPAKTAASGSSLADRFGAVPVVAEGEVDPDQDELLDQLAEHPDDIGLHLELVSLYYSRRDVEHFEAAAEAMEAHVVDPQQDEWQDVLSMGRDLVPEHPLFAGAPSAEHDPEFAHGATDEVDADHYEAQSAEHVDMPPLPQRHKVSEYHFDFDLTPQAHHDANAPVASAEEREAFDLDRGDESAEVAVEDAPRASWQFETTEENFGGDDPQQFSDDPIDTKLDLARAYMDMGDADGARAMLEEVVNEGSQMQKDAAKRLLDSMH
jgi:pilus assembly protein FimV